MSGLLNREKKQWRKPKKDINKFVPMSVSNVFDPFHKLWARVIQQAMHDYINPIPPKVVLKTPGQLKRFYDNGRPCNTLEARQQRQDTVIKSAKKRFIEERKVLTEFLFSDEIFPHNLLWISQHICHTDCDGMVACIREYLEGKEPDLSDVCDSMTIYYSPR